MSFYECGCQENGREAQTREATVLLFGTCQKNPLNMDTISAEAELSICVVGLEGEGAVERCECPALVPLTASHHVDI